MCPILHELVNILLHIFKHEVKIVVHTNYLLELHNALMIKFSQRLDLS